MMIARKAKLSSFVLWLIGSKLKGGGEQGVDSNDSSRIIEL